jgi:hypothetical protein
LLRIKGDDSLLETVKMPSDCLDKYRTDGGPLTGHALYWAIFNDRAKRTRTAHLVKQDQIEEFKSKGVSTIVPAYPKGPEWHTKEAGAKISF